MKPWRHMWKKVEMAQARLEDHRGRYDDLPPDALCDCVVCLDQLDIVDKDGAAIARRIIAEVAEMS